MTVIAWDGHVLAADKQATWNDNKFAVRKLDTMQGDDGVIVFATAGCAVTGDRMVAWYKAGAVEDEYPGTDTEDEGALMVVANSKGVRMYSSDMPGCMPLDEPYYAWGNGSDLALGAMAMALRLGCDADAIGAVECACMHNIYCGLGVDYVEVIPR